MYVYPVQASRQVFHSSEVLEPWAERRVRPEQTCCYESSPSSNRVLRGSSEGSTGVSSAGGSAFRLTCQEAQRPKRGAWPEAPPPPPEDQTQCRYHGHRCRGDPGKGRSGAEGRGRRSLRRTKRSAPAPPSRPPRPERASPSGCPACGEAS